MQALGVRRIALVSPYWAAVMTVCETLLRNEASAWSSSRSAFGAADGYAIGKLDDDHAREAFVRINRPEIEAFVVPGGNFPTMPHIAAWEQTLHKPVVTTNQAALWAVLRVLRWHEKLPGLGRLLAKMPGVA